MDIFRYKYIHRKGQDKVKQPATNRQTGPDRQPARLAVRFTVGLTGLKIIERQKKNKNRQTDR